MPFVSFRFISFVLLVFSTDIIFFSPCFALFSLFVLLVFCAQHGEWVAVGGWAVAGQITHTPLGTCINTFAHIMKMTCRRKRTGKSVGAKCVFRLSATPTRIYPDQTSQGKPSPPTPSPAPRRRGEWHAHWSPTAAVAYVCAHLILGISGKGTLDWSRTKDSNEPTSKNSQLAVCVCVCVGCLSILLDYINVNATGRQHSTSAAIWPALCCCCQFALFGSPLFRGFFYKQ